MLGSLLQLLIGCAYYVSLQFLHEFSCNLGGEYGCIAHHPEFVTIDMIIVTAVEDLGRRNSGSGFSGLG